MPKESQTKNTSFEDAARSLGCDESEERFDAALRKIARHKPKPETPPEKNEKPKKSKPAK